jgi:arginine repressor
MNGLIGTVAGDDTIFCIASEEIGGANMAEKLRELAGIATKSKVRKVS